MARIGIDMRFAVDNRRGIGNYCLQLVTHLAALDHENEYFLYIHKVDNEPVLPQNDNFHVRHIACGNYLIWEQALLPLYATLDKIDVLHCTGNTGPIFLSHSIKKVMTIHDVAYLKSYAEIPKSKSTYQKLGRIYRRFIVPWAAKKAVKFITVSQFAKRDIVNSIPCITDDDVFVTYLGINNSFQAMTKTVAKEFLRSHFGIDGAFILGFAAPDPQKNTMRLLENFLVLMQRENLGCKLVLAGLKDWRFSEFYQFAVGKNALDKVVFLEFIQHDELKYLYSAAEFFVFPSLYESFGFPPLEAMACGTPVITSNTGAIPEIVGDAAYLIDPTDDASMQRSMLDMYCCETLRNDYLKKGVLKTKQFNWVNLAEQTRAVYESALHSARI